MTTRTDPASVRVCPGSSLNPDRTRTRKRLETSGCHGVTVVTVHSSCARESVCVCPRADSVPVPTPTPSFLKSNQDNHDTVTRPENKAVACPGSVTVLPDNQDNTMLDPRTVPIARGLAPPIALQDAVRALSVILTGAHPSAPLDAPWRASYARWRADASRAAQALPRGTHAQRRLERAAWELLGAADAIAEAADA